MATDYSKFKQTTDNPSTIYSKPLQIQTHIVNRNQNKLKRDVIDAGVWRKNLIDSSARLFFQAQFIRIQNPHAHMPVMSHVLTNVNSGQS